MLVLAAFTLALTATGSLGFDRSLDQMWNDFKVRFGKQYGNQESYRRGLWEENYWFVHQQNSRFTTGQSRFSLKLNRFADLSLSEFSQQMNGLRARSGSPSGPVGPSPGGGRRPGFGRFSDNERETRAYNPFYGGSGCSRFSRLAGQQSGRLGGARGVGANGNGAGNGAGNGNIGGNTGGAGGLQAGGLPRHVDWRRHGYVTPVKDQGSCGSCWTFAATGALEGQWFKQTGQLVPLSEQNLLDCISERSPNLGSCNGGHFDTAYEWVMKNGGINTGMSYPYEGTEGPCRYNSRTAKAATRSYVEVAKYSEEDLQQKVAALGPVTVGMDADLRTFMFYSGGVYSDPRCDSDKLSHAVLAVGYGTDSGQDYWLVKNSWGTGWGEDGYFRMARNANNMCGIATDASIPVLS